MRSWRHLAWLAACTLALAGAAPAEDSYDLVRAGNAAFDRGDTTAAMTNYARAEEHTPDPGLVAYNEGAVLYCMALESTDHSSAALLFRDAERHYRRCLEDAVGSRRQRALYELGNALVQRAGWRNVKRLQAAIDCYQQCLAEKDLAPALAEDALHNRDVARVRLQAAAKARNNADSDPDAANESPPDSPECRPGDWQPEFGGSDADHHAGQGSAVPLPGANAGQRPSPTEKRRTIRVTAVRRPFPTTRNWSPCLQTKPTISSNKRRCASVKHAGSTGRS